MENSNLRKIQLAECIVLDEIDRICKKHNLTYYLAGGTLLGAIRHEGFIPWDDDLDVAMPRKDYEKFAELCKSELSRDFYYQSTAAEPSYNLYLAKIRLNGTRLVDERTKNLDINHGIYVDIFPLDYCNSIGISTRIRSSLFSLCAKIKAVKIGIAKKTDKKKNIKILIARFLTFFLPVGFINSFVNKIMCLKKDGKMYINFCSKYGVSRQTMPTTWFGKGKDVLFEGKYYNAPVEYNRVLSNIYGDYMKIPPVEKRCTVHNFIEINLGKYENIVSELMKS